jgi:hypothetical protein
MMMTNEINDAPLKPLHKKIFTLVWILTISYAWISSLFFFSPHFSFSWVSQSPGLYILVITAFMALSIIFFKLDSARFSFLTILAYVANCVLGAIIIHPIVSFLGWLGMLVLFVIVAVQSTIFVATWIHTNAVVEPENHLRFWIPVLAVQGVGIGSTFFVIATETRLGWTSFIYIAPVFSWLIYAVVGFIIAVCWGGSMLRTTARIDQLAGEGCWGRGLHIITKSCVKISVSIPIILLECVNFDDGPEGTFAILDAIEKW